MKNILSLNSKLCCQQEEINLACESLEKTKQKIIQMVKKSINMNLIPEITIWGYERWLERHKNKSLKESRELGLGLHYFVTTDERVDISRVVAVDVSPAHAGKLPVFYEDGSVVVLKGFESYELISQKQFHDGSEGEEELYLFLASNSKYLEKYLLKGNDS